MENISENYWSVRFFVTNEISPELNNFFETYFDAVVVEKNIKEIIGYKTDNFLQEDMENQAKIFNVKLPDYTVEIFKNKNWLIENAIQFSPFEVGNFLIFDAQDIKKCNTKKIPMKIYAATAFGSNHQTTRMCLKAISQIANNKKVCDRILDIGTGSGILAIAAAKLWKNSTIMAVDIDKEAVNVCKNNVIENCVENNIHCFLGDGYQLTEILDSAPYDLIMANIFARPLISMAENMSKNLKIGGFGVISGFIDEQLEWVIKEHQRYNLKVIKIMKLQNWRAVVLEKIS